MSAVDEKQTLQLPTVHLNGTGRRGLEAQYENASEGLRKALEAMSEMGPNGRDYYPQGPGAFGRAVDQHFARCAKVRGVLEEVNELWRRLVDGETP